jgi:hypothetical protein
MKRVEELERKAKAEEVEVRATSMGKEEAFEYLARLVTKEKAERHKEQFEEEWSVLKELPREDQERALRLLAREIEIKEEKEKVLPPKRPPIPRKAYEEARKAPTFYALLEKYFDEEIEKRRG